MRNDGYRIFDLGRKSKKVRNKTSAVAAFDNAKRLEKAGGPKVSKRNNDVELLSMIIYHLFIVVYYSSIFEYRIEAINLTCTFQNNQLEPRP